ncbi:tyrosyl-DNA phosphodiesterase 2 isoform X2 [Latimeria chalumnae]|uniref:tyrosyl-DNA phosphodiesterase 2 isoform X2 n=1 Tax=Latimeria chalumnae TaxID=7897 RepID=UPI00313C3C9F
MDEEVEVQADVGLQSFLLLEERSRLCAEFAAISNTDQAIAQCYLAENDWDMERALNSFLDPVEPFCADMTQVTTSNDREEQAGEAPEACVDLTAAEDVTATVSSEGSAVCMQEDDSTFSLLTWNIDGLDGENVRERAKAVCSTLALYSPDVVFLQEVVPPYLIYLRKRAVSYTIIAGNEEGYFTAIMLKKTRVKLLNQEITSFPTTTMLRNLLTVHVKISGSEIYLMTSHLESTKQRSEERLKQLKTVLKNMKAAPGSATVIFGGDTNLRDKELTSLSVPIVQRPQIYVAGGYIEPGRERTGGESGKSRGNKRC